MVAQTSLELGKDVRLKSKANDGLQSDDAHECSGPFGLDKSPCIMTDTQSWIRRGHALSTSVSLVVLI